MPPARDAEGPLTSCERSRGPSAVDLPALARTARATGGPACANDQGAGCRCAVPRRAEPIP